MLLNGEATADNSRKVGKVNFADVFVPFGREAVCVEPTFLIDVDVQKRIVFLERFRNIRFPNSRWAEDEDDWLHVRHTSCLPNALVTGRRVPFPADPVRPVVILLSVLFLQQS
jgi:hypothetical protein